jgi:transcriptional regulator with XRE-family HTH domain
MDLTNKIKQLREERNWTQDELAKRSGLDRAYIAAIETKQIKKPSVGSFIKLARAFKIRPEELYQAAGYIKDVRTTIPHKESWDEILVRFNVAMPSSVPIYEEFPFHAGEDVAPIDFIPMVKNHVKKRNLEGYIVRGSCLRPKIEDKDIIIIDRDAPIENGDIVACLVDGKMHLARLRKIANELWLENNDGRILFTECEVAAPVIEVRRRLKQDS